MHVTCIKITEAQQAKICNNYKNTKLKLLKTNAAIWFKKVYNITNSYIYNTCVTWKSIDYKLPADGTIVSKYVGG